MILKTKRLVLREFCLADAAFILELLNEPAWLRFIGNKKIKTLEDARTYLTNGPIQSYAENGFGLYAVDLDGVAIGMCGLIRRDTLPDVDVGFALLTRFAGQGFATEAARATLELGYGKLGLARIIAITHPENSASIHVLEKIGLKLEKRVRLPDSESDSLVFVPKS